MACARSGILRKQGYGTWVNWTEEDPQRVRLLKEKASQLLNCYMHIPAGEGTDSDFEDSTRAHYRTAVCRRAIAGLQGWQGYTSYGVDFGESEVQDCGQCSQAILQNYTALEDTLISQSSVALLDVGRGENNRGTSGNPELLSTVLNQIQQNYFLHIWNMIPVSCAAKLFLKTRLTHRDVKAWVWKHEGGVGTLCSSMLQLSKHYDVARVQRCFLRDILLEAQNCIYWQPQLSTSRQVAILGSYPMHHFSQCPDLAEDIDVFVQSKAVGEQIIGRYQKMLLMNLDYRTQVQHNTSYVPRNFTAASYSQSDIKKSMETSYG